MSKRLPVGGDPIVTTISLVLTLISLGFEIYKASQDEVQK